MTETSRFPHLLENRIKAERRVPSSVMLCSASPLRTNVLGEMYRLHRQGDKNRRARNNVSSN
jgi:hypothetical protein